MSCATRLGLAAALSLLPSIPAAAQEPPPVTYALPTLDPTPSGDRFFAVPDAQVHGFLDLHFGLFGGYAHRPMRHAGASTDYVDGQIGLNADVTVALAELLLLNLDLPVIVNAASAVESGLGDLRFTLRLKPFSLQDEAFNLGLQGDIFFPTGSGDALAGDGYVRGHPRLLIGGRSRTLAYSASVGYLFRKSEDLGGQILGGSVSYGVAVGALLAQDSLQIGPELFGHVPTSQEGAESFRHAAAFEALLGAKLRVRHVVLGAAGGIGITKAPGVPDGRGQISIAYVRDLRVLDRDGDRLDDVDDACPGEPGFESDGCPAPDRDGDSIYDVDDACPGEPGLVHAEPSKHGCPPPGPPIGEGPARPW